MIKTTKKLLTLCLTVIMIASMCCTSVVAAETTENNLSNGEIGLLKLLNIVTEETPELSSKITRGELAHMVVATANAGNFTGSEISPFYDVSTEHKYYNDICYLVSQGIISGDGKGRFNPDKPATFTDACKMFSMILGYNYAEGRYTYLEMAKKAGFLDGVKVHNHELSYSDALALAYNTLHCYMFEIFAFTKDFEYKVNEDCRALERFHGLLEYKGVVSGVGGTTLTEANDNIGNDRIIVDGKTYIYEGGHNLLGMYSVYYVKKNPTDEYAINIEYIYADENKNKVLTINSDDIKSFISGEFTYYEGRKKKTIDITGRMDVIYNGIAHPDYVNSDFTTVDGKISFIDNSRDGKYDVIKIESFTYAVVGGVDTTDNVIYAEYPAGKVIGDANNVEINYYDAGRLAYFGGLKKGAVISIKESKNLADGSKITINQLDSPINGKITALDKETITIDNKEYRLSPNHVSDEKLRIGMDVAAYINAGRCAVVLNNQSGTFSVGYMLAAETEGKRQNEYVRIMVLDYSKQKVIYDCSKNLRIDGIKPDDASKALELLRTSAAETNGTKDSEWPYSQLIRYKINDEDKVTYIDTLNKESTEGNDSLQLYKPNGVGANTNIYYSTNKGFHETSAQNFVFSVPATAKVWFIPNNARMDDSWYRVGNSFTHTAQYTVEAYNVGEYDRQAEYVLAYFTPTSSVANDSTPYIVEEITTVYYDNEECYKVVLTGTSTVTGYIRKDLMNASISRGDVVRFTQNYKGELIRFEKIFDPDEETAIANRVVSSLTNSSNKLLSSMIFTYGTAVATTDTSLVHTTSVANDVGGVENYAGLNNYAISGGTKVFVYDRIDKRVSMGTVNDIVPYSLSQYEASQIAVYTTYGNTQYLYIIK